MKVWYDALTGKHVRYAVAIAQRLRNSGHKVILTTRKHPDTIGLADFLHEKFTIAGKYEPKSLLTRLRSGTRRQLQFCKLFEKTAPDIAISHGSADLCRVAFGLGKPIITTVDTPYAEAVHRLTLPLSNYIVASKAIPSNILKTYNVKAEMVSFSGVDEVVWIKHFKPKITYDFGRPLIVVRQLEEKAVYTNNPANLTTLAKKLTKLGKVVFLSRYHRKTVKNLIVPKGFIDSASLVAQADLFVGVGGTITREAALQGTPAIIVNVFKDQYVNDFLIDKGFPIFKTEPSDAMALAEKLVSKKCNVKHLLNKLEDPVNTIENIIKDKAIAH
jgi:predicted glycosyltransferase